MNIIDISCCRYDFKGIIDYIFHSADTMSALGVLGPIDPDWFRDNKVMGCPHPHIPSGKLTSCTSVVQYRFLSLSNSDAFLKIQLCTEQLCCEHIITWDQGSLSSLYYEQEGLYDSECVT